MREGMDEIDVSSSDKNDLVDVAVSPAGSRSPGLKGQAYVFSWWIPHSLRPYLTLENGDIWKGTSFVGAGIFLAISGAFGLLADPIDWILFGWFAGSNAVHGANCIGLDNTFNRLRRYPGSSDEAFWYSLMGHPVQKPDWKKFTPEVVQQGRAYAVEGTHAVMARFARYPSASLDLQALSRLWAPEDDRIFPTLKYFVCMKQYHPRKVLDLIDMDRYATHFTHVYNYETWNQRGQYCEYACTASLCGYLMLQVHPKSFPRLRVPFLASTIAFGIATTTLSVVRPYHFTHALDGFNDKALVYNMIERADAEVIGVMKTRMNKMYDGGDSQ